MRRSGVVHPLPTAPIQLGNGAVDKAWTTPREDHDQLDRRKASAVQGKGGAVFVSPKGQFLMSLDNSEEPRGDLGIECCAIARAIVRTRPLALVLVAALAYCSSADQSADLESSLGFTSLSPEHAWNIDNLNVHPGADTSNKPPIPTLISYQVPCGPDACPMSPNLLASGLGSGRPRLFHTNGKTLTAGAIGKGGDKS